jgi:hypothetical protein
MRVAIGVALLSALSAGAGSPSPSDATVPAGRTPLIGVSDLT